MSYPTGLLANLLSLTVVLFTYRHSGDPRVMVFTFILLALARFITVEIFYGTRHFFPGTQPFLERFVSPRSGRKKPNLVTEGNTNKPAGDWGYFFFIFIPAIIGLAVMMDKQQVPLETLQAEGQWSLIYLGIYWVQDLFERKTVMEFDQSRVYNLAYNMGPVLVLFLAVLAGGVAYGFLQKIITPTPWFICGPLIVFKHLSDFHFSRRGHRHSMKAEA